MGSQPYAGKLYSAPQADSLLVTHNMTAVAARASLAPIATYSDLDASFSAISSFNLPAACDPSLLTPISLAGSPPLHSTPKFGSQYLPPGTPQQEPSPPASTAMYPQPWANQFEINGQPSQTSSPMPPQSNLPPGYLDADQYITDERRGTPGPPPGSYLGHFGVSGGPDHSPYYPVIENPHPLDDPSLGLGMPRSQHPSVAPLLSHTHPNFRNNRRQSGDAPSASNQSDHGQSASGSPKRRVLSHGTRIKKKAAKRQGAQIGQSRSNIHTTGSVAEHSNIRGETVAPRLKPDCPDEVRCIFESRWRHREQKGQDMWDSIQADFEHDFKKTQNKEMLQMKFKRGRSKYIDWLPEDENALREAWREMENERYEVLLQKFHEKGGSRNMQLSASDIEVKVVADLKLEEDVYVDSIKDVEIRRRRRINARKRSSARGGDASNDTIMADELMSNSIINEDEVITQVHERRRHETWAAGPSAGNPTLDAHAQMWDRYAPRQDPYARRRAP